MKIQHVPFEEIADVNRQVDKTAIERCDHATQQLADVGIKLGGYKLEPALGGTVLDRSLLNSTRSPQNLRQG